MSNFFTLTVKQKVIETTDCFSLIFSAENEPDFIFEAGQFLTLIFDMEDGEEIRRSFSISSSPLDLPLIRITIKKSDSFLSNRCDHLSAGDAVKVYPPLGNFILPKNPENTNFIFIGAGSGITPLFSKIKSLLYSTSQSNLSLIYGNRDESSIIFKKELDDLQKKLPDRFRIDYILSQPGKNYQGESGRISEHHIEKIIAGYTQQELDDLEFHICGPKEMMRNLTKYLQKISIPQHQIKKEDFICEILEDFTLYEGLPQTITLYYRKNKIFLDVPPGQSILEAALRNRINLPNSCNNGSCGTCRAKLLSGRVILKEQKFLSHDNIHNGYCLSCTCYPVSDDVVIFYDDPFDI